MNRESISTDTGNQMAPQVSYTLTSLFDSEYYLKQTGEREINIAGDPLRHYMDEGWRLGLNPHPLFDTRWSLLQVKLVTGQEINPLAYFCRDTRKKWINPHPLFFVNYYRDGMKSRGIRASNPLLHYLTSGWRLGLSPNPFFDPEYYVRQISSPEISGMAPLLHYAILGWKDGIAPSPLFKRGEWGVGLPKSLTSGVDPLQEFVERGVYQIVSPWKNWVDVFRSYYPELYPSCEFVPDGRIRFSSERGEAICAKRKPIIFLHIPKTAGVSLRDLWMKRNRRGEVLYAYHNRFDLDCPDEEFLDKLKLVRPGPSSIYGHVSFGIHRLLNWPEAAYMTLLRHPVDRVISLYRHNAMDPHSEYFQLINEGLTLREFIESQTSAETNNFSVRTLCGIGLQMERTPSRANEFWKKRGLFPKVKIEDRSFLEKAFENIEREFCFVGTTERINWAVERIEKGLGWRRSKLKELNVSPAYNKNVVDKDVRALIEKYNQLDLELFEKFNGKFHENFELLKDSEEEGNS